MPHRVDSTPPAGKPKPRTDSDADGERVADHVDDMIKLGQQFGDDLDERAALGSGQGSPRLGVGGGGGGAAAAGGGEEGALRSFPEASFTSPRHAARDVPSDVSISESDMGGSPGTPGSTGSTGSNSMAMFRSRRDPNLSPRSSPGGSLEIGAHTLLSTNAMLHSLQRLRGTGSPGGSSPLARRLHGFGSPENRSAASPRSPRTPIAGAGSEGKGRDKGKSTPTLSSPPVFSDEDSDGTSSVRKERKGKETVAAGKNTGQAASGASGKSVNTGPSGGRVAKALRPGGPGAAGRGKGRGRGRGVASAGGAGGAGGGAAGSVGGARLAAKLDSLTPGDGRVPGQDPALMSAPPASVVDSSAVASAGATLPDSKLVQEAKRRAAARTYRASTNDTSAGTGAADATESNAPHIWISMTDATGSIEEAQAKSEAAEAELEREHRVMEQLAAENARLKRQADATMRAGRHGAMTRTGSVDNMVSGLDDLEAQVAAKLAADQEVAGGSVDPAKAAAVSASDALSSSSSSTASSSTTGRISSSSSTDPSLTFADPQFAAPSGLRVKWGTRRDTVHQEPAAWGGSGDDGGGDGDGDGGKAGASGGPDTGEEGGEEGGSRRGDTAVAEEVGKTDGQGQPPLSSNNEEYDDEDEDAGAHEIDLDEDSPTRARSKTYVVGSRVGRGDTDGGVIPVVEGDLDAKETTETSETKEMNETSTESTAARRAGEAEGPGGARETVPKGASTTPLTANPIVPQTDDGPIEPSPDDEVAALPVDEHDAGAEDKNEHDLLASLDCDALVEMVEEAEEAGNYAAITGILAHAASFLEEDGEEVAEGALDALMRLASSGPAVAALGEAGACEAVAVAAKVFMEEPSVMEVALGCFRKLAADNTENQARLGAASAPALLVTAMATHTEGEPTLQEMGCLAVVAMCPGNAAALKEAGVEVSLEAAKPLIENDRNKTYPDKAMAALASAVSGESGDGKIAGAGVGAAVETVEEVDTTDNAAKEAAMEAGKEKTETEETKAAAVETVDEADAHVEVAKDVGKEEADTEETTAAAATPGSSQDVDTKDEDKEEQNEEGENDADDNGHLEAARLLVAAGGVDLVEDTELEDLRREIAAEYIVCFWKLRVKTRILRAEHRQKKDAARASANATAGGSGEEVNMPNTPTNEPSTKSPHGGATEHDRRAAVTKMQARHRGALGRRHARAVRTAEHSRLAAVVQLQSMLRGFVARHRARKAHIRRESGLVAVSYLQQRWRWHMAKSALKVVTRETVQRGNAAARVQAITRGVLSRRKRDEKQSAVVQMQQDLPRQQPNMGGRRGAGGGVPASSASVVAVAGAPRAQYPPSPPQRPLSGQVQFPSSPALTSGGAHGGKARFPPSPKPIDVETEFPADPTVAVSGSSVHYPPSPRQREAAVGTVDFPPSPSLRGVGSQSALLSEYPPPLQPIGKGMDFPSCPSKVTGKASSSAQYPACPRGAIGGTVAFPPSPNLAAADPPGGSRGPTYPPPLQPMGAGGDFPLAPPMDGSGPSYPVPLQPMGAGGAIPASPAMANTVLNVPYPPPPRSKSSLSLPAVVFPPSPTACDAAAAATRAEQQQKQQDELQTFEAARGVQQAWRSQAARRQSVSKREERHAAVVEACASPIWSSSPPRSPRRSPRSPQRSPNRSSSIDHRSPRRGPKTLSWDDSDDVSPVAPAALTVPVAPACVQRTPAVAVVADARSPALAVKAVADSSEIDVKEVAPAKVRGGATPALDKSATNTVAEESAYTRAARPSPMALSSAELRKRERRTTFNHVSPLHADAVVDGKKGLATVAETTASVTMATPAMATVGKMKTKKGAMKEVQEIVPGKVRRGGAEGKASPGLANGAAAINVKGAQAPAVAKSAAIAAKTATATKPATSTKSAPSVAEVQRDLMSQVLPMVGGDAQMARKMVATIGQLPNATQKMLLQTPAQLRAVLKQLGATVAATTVSVVAKPAARGNKTEMGTEGTESESKSQRTVT